MIAPASQPLPRVVAVTPYWSFWEHRVGRTFREERLDLARRATDMVRQQMDVVDVLDVASAEDAMALAGRWAGFRADVLLVIQTMAVPSAYMITLLEAIGAVPVVVWALHERGVEDGEVDHRTITTQGATVGAPMLSNVLTRRGRAFDLVVGRLEDGETNQRVKRAVVAASAAGRIRSSRLGLIGRPQEGYLHVDVDHAELERSTGIRVVTIPPSDFAEAFVDADEAEVESRVAAVRDSWVVDGDVPKDVLSDSVRAAVALEVLGRVHGLEGGAMNCHVPEIRFNQAIGITPCWALGSETSAGRPWTCTGDLLTAVAMLATKRLGGAALYHELETIDYETDEIVIANSGEHDLAWGAPGSVPRLGLNGWFCGTDPRCGACAVLHPAPGPATLVGFTPHPAARGGFRFVVATGTLSSRVFPATGTSNGAFRFASGPAPEGWLRWAVAGVNHHGSATPGDLSQEVQLLAMHLGIEAVLT